VLEEDDVVEEDVEELKLESLRTDSGAGSMDVSVAS
jgi:hypothetical protein